MNLLVYAFLALLSAPTTQKVPPPLIGTWDIGKPYDTPGPIGIDAKEEGFILSLRITYFGDHLHVCDRDVSAEPLKVEVITRYDFLQRYGFIPDVIGLARGPITDITLNASHGVNACDFSGVHVAPGAHVLTDQKGRSVVEVGNAYFPLTRR